MYVCNNWNDFCEFVRGEITPCRVKQGIDGNRKCKADMRSYRMFDT
jgi:hypothetical protein